MLAAHGDLVAVHDAARPFVSEAVIEAAVYAAAACGAAAPAVPVKDTVKRAVRGDGKTVPEACMVAETPDRSTLYAVQTPSASTVPPIWLRWKSWMQKRPASSPTIAACSS